ncbi:MAG: L-lactate permease [Acidobacteriota bacterium]
MTPVANSQMWSQLLDPLHALPASALVATIPLVIVLVLMGVLRKSGLVAALFGLGSTAALAAMVWQMPVPLIGWSLAYGFAFAAWSILWVVFNGLWLYNLTIAIGSFDRLRRWIAERASGDACIQATLVAFCFGALLEGNAGFGVPVAITAFLLVGLGFQPRRAVLVSLIANTVPVAFGGVGVPIVALAGVTGLDVMKLSAAVGRQLPFLSLLLPAYLTLVVGGWSGLRRTWPVALVAGGTFATAQFLVSNLWGPYATDVVSALTSTFATVLWLRVWSPEPHPDSAPNPKASHSAASDSPTRVSLRDVLTGWFPWAVLSVVMIGWSYFQLFPIAQRLVPIPRLHNGVLIALYQKPYSAVFAFQPLAGGTAVLVSLLVTAVWFRVAPRVLLDTAVKTLLQLRVPGLSVLMIVGLAYLYNYSGMAYTLGAALAGVGPVFPFVSSVLGWVACFLSGSDTSANLLFGNLQVAAAHQLNLNPILMAATNSSGAVAGKMISPQNIAVGVTTVGLIGEEGRVLQSAFWHSILFAALIGLLACLQAYVVPGMMP